MCPSPCGAYSLLVTRRAIVRVGPTRTKLKGGETTNQATRVGGRAFESCLWKGPHQAFPLASGF